MWRIQIDPIQWDINITLTNRDIMHHHMLLGREAMAKLLANPGEGSAVVVVAGGALTLEAFWMYAWLISNWAHF